MVADLGDPTEVSFLLLRRKCTVGRCGLAVKNVRNFVNDAHSPKNSGELTEHGSRWLCHYT